VVLTLTNSNFPLVHSRPTETNFRPVTTPGRISKAFQPRRTLPQPIEFHPLARGAGFS
jgi:hypothetical protein